VKLPHDAVRIGIAAVALWTRFLAVVGTTKTVVLVTRGAQSPPRSSIKGNCVAVRHLPREANGRGNRSPLAGMPVVLWRKGVRDFVQHHLFALLDWPQCAQILRHRNGSSAVVAQTAALFGVIEPENPRL